MKPERLDSKKFLELSNFANVPINNYNGGKLNSPQKESFVGEVATKILEEGCDPSMLDDRAVEILCQLTDTRIPNGEQGVEERNEAIQEAIKRLKKLIRAKILGSNYNGQCTI